MVNLRKFCISDELFSGFETMVDLDEVQSIDGIIKDVLNNAFVVLRQNIHLERWWPKSSYTVYSSICSLRNS